MHQKPLHIQRLHATFSKWLYLTSFDTIDVVAATFLANRLEGARLWVCLLGPSSCGKTTMAESITDLPNVHSIDAIGGGTFASGYRVKDSDERFGLFEKLSDGKPHMLIVPDFSTILQEVPQVRNKVLSQLRRIYDGKWNQHHGTGVDVDWSGKIGMIACATPNWERIVGSEAVFGERFICWKMHSPDPRALGERALRNTERTDEMKKALRAAMRDIGKLRPVGDLKIPLNLRNALSREVAFVALARTPVSRDPRTREILEKPYEESPTRLAQQLGQLIKGLLVLYQTTEMDEDLMEIVECCAYSSIPNNRLWVMSAIGRKPATFHDLWRESGLPRSVAWRTVEDLREIGLLHQSGSTHDSSLWTPDEEWRGFFNRVRSVLNRSHSKGESE